MPPSRQPKTTRPMSKNPNRRRGWPGSGRALHESPGRSIDAMVVYLHYDHLPRDTQYVVECGDTGFAAPLERLLQAMAIERCKP